MRRPIPAQHDTVSRGLPACDRAVSPFETGLTGRRAVIVLLLSAAAAMVLASAGGCTILHTDNHCRYDGPCYEKATLVYELSGTCGALASTAIRRAYNLSTGEDEEAFQAPPPGRLSWQAAVVTIQYPHPDLGCRSARATIRLSCQPILRTSPRQGIHLGRMVTSAAATVNPKCQPPPALIDARPRSAKVSTVADEIWTMDISKSELDLLLCDLSTGGFFGQQWRPIGGSWLYVDVEGCTTKKAWTPEPRLDDLIARVFGEGTLEQPPPPELEPVPEEPPSEKRRIITPPGVLPEPPPPAAEAPAESDAETVFRTTEPSVLSRIIPVHTEIFGDEDAPAKNSVEANLEEADDDRGVIRGDFR